jgi:hypothetical protein
MLLDEGGRIPETLKKLSKKKIKKNDIIFDV